MAEKQYEQAAGELQKVEEQMSDAQRRYSVARQEWFSAGIKLDIPALPTSMEIRNVRLHDDPNGISVVARFGNHEVAATFRGQNAPRFDGDFRFKDADIDYSKIGVQVDGSEQFDPDKANAVARKMILLWAAWQKLVSRENELFQQAPAELLVRDIFNV